MDQQCGDRDSDHSAAGQSTVTFFDAGNAFGDPWKGSINFADLRMAYGGELHPQWDHRFEWIPNQSV